MALCLYPNRPRGCHLAGNFNIKKSETEILSRVQRRRYCRLTRQTGTLSRHGFVENNLQERLPGRRPHRYLLAVGTRQASRADIRSGTALVVRSGRESARLSNNHSSTSSSDDKGDRQRDGGHSDNTGGDRRLPNWPHGDVKLD